MCRGSLSRHALVTIWVALGIAPDQGLPGSASIEYGAQSDNFRNFRNPLRKSATLWEVS